MLRLIKMWLKAPIVEERPDGKKQVHRNNKGTPQGGVISPLLANSYLNILDTLWKVKEVESRMEARLVRYADTGYGGYGAVVGIWHLHQTVSFFHSSNFKMRSQQLIYKMPYDNCGTASVTASTAAPRLAPRLKLRHRVGTASPRPASTASKAFRLKTTFISLSAEVTLSETP